MELWIGWRRQRRRWWCPGKTLLAFVTLSLRVKYSWGFINPEHTTEVGPLNEQGIRPDVLVGEEVGPSTKENGSLVLGAAGKIGGATGRTRRSFPSPPRRHLRIVTDVLRFIEGRLFREWVLARRLFKNVIVKRSFQLQYSFNGSQVEILLFARTIGIVLKLRGYETNYLHIFVHTIGGSHSHSWSCWQETAEQGVYPRRLGLYVVQTAKEEAIRRAICEYEFAKRYECLLKSL